MFGKLSDVPIVFGNTELKVMEGKESEEKDEGMYEEVADVGEDDGIEDSE